MARGKRVIKVPDEKRNCETHGKQLFQYKENKKGSWWICQICLREQWRKHQSIRRKQPKVKEYYKIKSIELLEARRLLQSLILLLGKILPPE